MGARLDKPLRGLATAAEQLILDNLTAQGAGVTSSSFTQAGPRPGQASTTDINAKLEPQISGGQQVAVELQVRRAGLPERGALGMIWRLDSDTDDDAWRGRPPPNFLNHWIAALWSDVEEYNFFDLVTVPSTQDLILLYIHSGPPTVLEEGHAKVFDFDATEPAWGAEIDVTVDPRGIPFSQKTWDAVCGVVLDNEKVLSYWADGRFLSAWASDNAGATWQVYSLPAVDVITTPERMRAVSYRGDVGLFTEELDDFQQFGSNSLGTKFVLVSSANDVGKSLSAVAIPGNGGIALAYSRFSDDLPVVRILSSVFDPFEDAAEIVIDAAVEVTDCTISADANGTLWLVGRDTTAPANPQDEVWVWFSLDGGANWARIKPTASDGFGLFTSNDNSTRIVDYASTWVRGWHVLGHNWVASPGNEDDSIGTMWSAGWSSLSTSGEELDSMYEHRFSWAPESGSTAIGSTGIPIELPQDTFWTLSGTAPTRVAPGELEFAIVAADGSVLLSPASTTPGDDVSFFFEGKITSGTGSSTALDFGFFLRVANGVDTEYLVDVRFDAANSRIRVFDVHGVATVVDIDIDVSRFVQIAAGINGASGQLTLAYRRPWQTRWTDATPGVEILTDGGFLIFSANQIRFGTVATTTVTGRVRQWHHSEQEFVKSGDAVGLELGLVGPAAIQSGGNINTLPFPVPEIGTPTHEAFLAAQRGPGRDEDLFTVAPFFDFGIDRIFPAISPSPADPWRSTAKNVQQLIVWDFGESTRVGQVWLLVAALLGTNIKTAFIEGGTGSAWSTQATYNAAIGFEGLTFSRTGDWIRPAAGTIDAARFLDRNVLRDGFAILDTGGTPTPRRILRNSAGGWTDPAVNSTLLPEVRLDGIIGSDPTTGLCDLVFPAGVTFHTYSPELPVAAEYFRYWRIRIPVQDVVDDYYQIGSFLLGAATVFGKQNSRGWSQGMEPNTSRRVSRFGTVRKRRDGPPARRWSMGWADGVFLGALRAAGVNQDFISPAAGDAAVAAVSDVWTLLWGLLEETGGGEAAVLALNSIPSADTTINDRLRFMLGTWDSGVQANQVVGNENTNEFMRIDPIRVSELV